MKRAHFNNEKGLGLCIIAVPRDVQNWEIKSRKIQKRARHKKTQF
jgi:hypothetical protein